MLPILYQNHDLILYSYPLLMGLGWGVGYQIYFANISPDFSRLKAQILFWGIFIFAWFGAKALFILSYPASNSDYYLQTNFWTGGGFVFYGGFLFALIYLGIYKLIDRSFKARDLWPMLPALAIGHGIGRIGCLLAGCCYGKPTELFWGIYLHDHYRHPTQAIEAICLIAFGVYVLKSKKDRVFLVASYLVFYGVLRFFIEALRGDSVRGFWGIMTPSQWISSFLVVSGAMVFISYKNSKLSKAV